MQNVQRKFVNKTRLSLVVEPTSPWFRLPPVLIIHNKTRHKGGLSCKWRIEWDSNPRYPLGVHTISNRAPSTTRPSIHISVT